MFAVRRRPRRLGRLRAIAVVTVLAMGLIATEVSGLGPAPAPARAATNPTVEQQLDEIERELEALRAAAPALAADGALAAEELANAGWEFLFGTWCSMADPLQRAVNALDHAESIAPASLKPLILAVSAHIFRVQAFVLSLSDELCDRPDVFHVDPEVKPSAPTGVDDMDGSAVPLGALADDEGVTTELVANEIMLETSDRTRVQSFITRFGGRLVETLPAEAGTPGAVELHTIRMDPARLVDTSRLAADLETLDPGWSGEILRSSDAQTLRLLATTARALVEGYPAQLNLVTKLDDVASGVTTEQIKTDWEPALWDPNAFNWSYMQNNLVQDIEVTTAWQTLERAGRLKPTVNVGIIDSGFDPANNGDFPAVTGYTSGLSGGPWAQHPALDPGQRWHGTKVANAMAGMLDNRIGAAGPAGPVVNRMHTVNYGTGTVRAWSRGIRKLRWRDTNVKIVNMSLSINPPQRLARLVGRGALEREINRISNDGALVFVSAGNQGENVDQEKCGRIRGCRERRLRMPCELSNVICVGGLRNNSRARSSGSNYGARDVDIWAPFSVWTGTDPTCGNDILVPCRVQFVNGTSYSSPFAAGVAALIWTANPGLTRTQVWDTMWRTATRVDGGNVSRIVHAGRAVADVIPPAVRITSPRQGQTFAAGTPIAARAETVNGTKGTPTSVRWFLGEAIVGTGTSTTLNLPPGTWTVAVGVRWADGTTASAAVTVTVTR